MITVLRAFIVWLMLLTVPFQGFASASMLLCAPVADATAKLTASVVAAQAQQGGHDHAAMLAAEHGATQHGGHDGGDGATDGGDHCGATGACCVGAPLAPAFPDRLPTQAASSQAIPFYSGAPSAVDLARLERPPRVSHS